MFPHIGSFFIVLDFSSATVRRAIYAVEHEKWSAVRRGRFMRRFLA
jgi:hypothetical protein